MTNTYNYAEKYSPKLLEIINQGALTSPFIVTAESLEFTGAKTFHFTQMSTSGYKDTNRESNSYNQGSFEQKDVEFTLTHERDISFGVHPSIIDETNLTASLEKVASTFVQTQDTPERDAYFFSKVSVTAISLNRSSESAESDWTPENVVKKLKNIIRSNNYYKSRGLILYLSPFIMDLLELSTTFTRNIDSTTLTENGVGIETRVTSLDSIPLIEVIDEDRFYTVFDFTEGFVPASNAQKINVLAATPLTVKSVIKYDEIMFAPRDAHHPKPTVTFASFGDTIIFPNGKNGVVDSVYVDVQPA